MLCKCVTYGFWTSSGIVFKTVLLLVILVIGLRSAVVAADGEGVVGDYAYEDIVAAISETEATLSTLSVKSKWEVKVPDSNAFKTFQTSRGSESVVLETDIPAGRVRCQVEGEATVSGKEHIKQPLLSIGVFDGEKTTEMSGGDDFTSGIITNSRNDLPWRFVPQEAVTHFQASPISRTLRKWPGEVIGEERVNGIDTVVVVTSPNRTNLDRRSRFHIAPSLNFSVVRRAIEAKLPDGTKWVEYHCIRCSDYREVVPGIWLPNAAISQMFFTEDKHFKSDVEPPLMGETVVEFSDWVVNPQLRDELFQIEFEPGVYVTNKITGQNYQVAGVNQAMLKAQSDEAAALLATARTRPPLLIFINIAVISTLAAILIFRRYRSSRA